MIWGIIIGFILGVVVFLAGMFVGVAFWTQFKSDQNSTNTFNYN